MSKVGTKSIAIPPSVQVTSAEQVVTVKGGLGQMAIHIPLLLSIEIKDQHLTVTRKNESKAARSLHGLFRTLIANAVTGVEKPWEKRMEVVGTGYNVKMQGQDLVFKVGYSHTVTFPHVEGIKFMVDGNSKVVVSGVDKQLVGEVAHKIKMIKSPDAYKGKGIRYEGEKLRIKPGKKAKAA